jgi:hypothetical protein
VALLRCAILLSDISASTLYALVDLCDVILVNGLQDAGMKLRRGNVAQALVKHSVQARPSSLRKRKKIPPFAIVATCRALRTQ